MQCVVYEGDLKQKESDLRASQEYNQNEVYIHMYRVIS